MLDDDTIAEQLKLLEAHRRTLAHYLQQEATMGRANTSPSVPHGIWDARAEIKRIKTTLRANGIAVDDHPHDDDPSPQELTSTYRADVAELYARLPFYIGYIGNPIYLKDVYFDLPIIKPEAPDILVHQTLLGHKPRGKRLGPLDNLLQAKGTAALVGMMGMGKTTTLQHLTWTYAQSQESVYWRSGELIPFFTTIRKLAHHWTEAERAKGAEGFVNALAGAVATNPGGTINIDKEGVSQVLRTAVSEGTALVLLDALDEFIAPENQRVEFVRGLQSLWGDTHIRKNPIVLTSRPYGFLNPNGFEMYTSEALELDGVELFADRLARAILKAKEVPVSEARSWRKALNLIIQSPYLKEFWTPLYITMMVQLGTSKGSEKEGLDLLRNIKRLTDLYNKFVHETIEWEKKKSSLIEASEYELKSVLGYIAYYTFVEPQGQHIDQAILNSIDIPLQTKEFRSICDFWLKTGLLIRDDERGSLAFRHSGFQSYGVAFALAGWWKSNQRERKAKCEELIKLYWTTPGWGLIWKLFEGLSKP